MAKKGASSITWIITLIIGLISGFIACKYYNSCCTCSKEVKKETVKYDDTNKTNWDNSFQVVEIPSPADGKVQKAYFYRSTSDKPRPLILSLHTWSGDYTQKDTIAYQAKEQNFNYIHPDFRGSNNTFEACCSPLVISDMDAAIDYAIANANVDTSKIYIIGTSGGGYATLAMFMKSKHTIKKFSAWVPISDILAWYYQSKIRKNKYAGDILKCISLTGDSLDMREAIKRSPFYWETPTEIRKSSKLEIFSGIYDGIQGSVPITQSINFYNKLLSDMGADREEDYVSDNEKLQLLEYRKPLEEFGKIGSREICLTKAYKNIRLTIFEGNHEILPEYAIINLIE